MTGMIGVSTDVTDRRKAQVELKSAFDKLQAAEQELQVALKDEKASKEELAQTFDNLKNTQSQLVQQEKNGFFGTIDRRYCARDQQPNQLCLQRNRYIENVHG